MSGWNSVGGLLCVVQSQSLKAWSCPVWRSSGPSSSMSTLLLFCRLYNHIQQPSKLGFGCDYCLFKVSFGVLFYCESAAAFIVCRDINTRLVSLSEPGSRTSLPTKVSACLCSFTHSLCISTLVVRRRQTQMPSWTTHTSGKCNLTHNNSITSAWSQYESVVPGVDPPWSIRLRIRHRAPVRAAFHLSLRDVVTFLLSPITPGWD